MNDMRIDDDASAKKAMEPWFGFLAGKVGAYPTLAHNVNSTLQSVNKHYKSNQQITHS